jgi:two-component system sensor histidine kinase KdpD
VRTLGRVVTTHSRGELRIYLGAAPGVGKTFALLAEAGRRAGRGTDIVVGHADPRGRPRTAELLAGLEVIPPRRLRHRGGEWVGLDLDAVLARAPEVVVIDDLAHTNPPGSRHAKRWQDVEELLTAGIDVLSAINVHHVESLNDVVARITGTPQLDTVPDEVIRRSEQVELVDVTPQALRRRLAHGNIHPATKIDAAVRQAFDEVHLGALRELALLWTAEQVDRTVQRLRANQGITDTWDIRERVVAAVTGGPESHTLIRRARRIATRAGADLLVVHVMGGVGPSGAAPDVLARTRAMAEDLGATFHTVVGDDVATALLDFARGVNATQLVLGTSRRGRLARTFIEGIGTAVVQASGPIDVHLVTHADGSGRTRWRPGASPLTARRKALGWVAAVALPALCAVLGLTVRGRLDMSTELAAFLLATLVVALYGGLGPALFCAAFGALLLNYYFTDPLDSFSIGSPSNALPLAAMVIVAVLVALVVDRAARQATQAAKAQTEAALLASYARAVLDANPVQSLLAQVRESFGQESASLLERHDNSWRPVSQVGLRPCSNPDDADVVVAVEADVVLALRGRPLSAGDQRALDAAAGQALLALRQQRLATETARARQRVESTELRTALLSAVGHDLHTPLTSIKAAVGSLRSPALRLSPADTDELTATIAESADRLIGVVDNLLDSSRLAAGAVTPRQRPLGYEEVVHAALANVDERHLVAVELDDRAPLVVADPGLLERVIANLIDNALRHGRDQGPDPAGGGRFVTVRADGHADRVELRVVDRGPGLHRKVLDTAFVPFQRLGDRHAPTGMGLGLSVARGFVEAMGGTITAEPTPGGGLTVVVSLPAYDPAKEGSP